jgi:hypothetical protein
MNCTEFERYLDESVERRQPPDAQQVRDHLAECRRNECRQLWEDLQLLARAVSAWRQVAPRIQLDETVLRQWAGGNRAAAGHSRTPLDRVFTIAAEGPAEATGAAEQRAAVRPLAPREARRRTAAAVVAGVVLLMTVGSLWTRMRQTGGDITDVGSTASQKTSAGADVLSGNSDPVADPALQDVSMSYVSMAQNATRMVTDTVVLTIGGEEELEEPNRAVQWIGGWQERIDPWGAEIGAAVERILETLPNDSPAT